MADTDIVTLVRTLQARDRELSLKLEGQRREVSQTEEHLKAVRAALSSFERVAKFEGLDLPSRAPAPDPTSGMDMFEGIRLVLRRAGQPLKATEVHHALVGIADQLAQGRPAVSSVRSVLSRHKRGEEDPQGWEMVGAGAGARWQLAQPEGGTDAAT